MAARDLREVIPTLARQGKTVLLTTHYMFEADAICDRIAIIHRGRIVAQGSPAEIKRRFSGIRVIDVTLKNPREGLLEEVGRVPGVQRVDAGSDGLLQRLTVQVSPDGDLRERVVEVVGTDNIETLLLRDPTLEEA